MHRMDTGLEYLLARVGKAHRYLIRQSLHDCGLHRGQPFLLMALHKQDGMTHSELAKSLEVRPPTITNMVKRLEREGLVERRRDEDDERVSRAFLTEDGKALITRIKPIPQQIEDVAFAGFSDEERQQMGQLLERVLSNLQQAIGDEGGRHLPGGHRPRHLRPGWEQGHEKGLAQVHDETDS